MQQIDKNFRKKLLELLLNAGNSIEAQMDQLVWKIGAILKQYRNNSSIDVWAMNGNIKAAVKSLLIGYSERVTTMIERQIKSVWILTESKNDLLIKQHLIGIGEVKVSTSRMYRYFNRILPIDIDPKLKIIVSETEIDRVFSAPRNTKALEAFLNRKVNGLKLSERVWKLTNDSVQPLIESYLADGIEAGKSAAQISREVREYLNFPDKLFRRVRDFKGKLKLSTSAQQFHPGQGVYRSSYKNAMRLAREETNLAYRSADHLRWNATDFITGITVELSEQHPTPDICDTLAGDYPKEFHFPSWHPQCLCHALPQLMPREQFKQYLKGEEVEVETIAEMPDQFKGWVKDNKERIEGWKSKPYFMTFNERYINQIINT